MTSFKIMMNSIGARMDPHHCNQNILSLRYFTILCTIKYIYISMKLKSF